MLERLFKLTENRTTVRVEVVGGLTTFITMAYIIVINPAILEFAGIPRGPSTTATIVTAAFGTLLMAFYANRPIAVAPYMGENAFIAFGMAALSVSWQQRLGAVFIAGVVFLLLTATHVRAWLADAISPSMKASFAVGIGLFLAFIGLYETGIVTSFVAGKPAAPPLVGPGGLLTTPDVPLMIGDLHQPAVLLAVAGFVLIAILLQRRVPGAILLGMAATGAAGLLLGLGKAPRAVVAVPFTGEYDLRAVALHLDVLGVLRVSFLPVLLTLILMSFLDTLGTLLGLGAAGGMLDEKGNFPQVERPMVVDALSCSFGALVGTSTSGAYIESATGIREGARTGLAALVTALLFLVALFFVPLIEPLQQMRYAYGPALIAVGVLMLEPVKRIAFDDLTEVVPSFASIVMMVFTYNIANGLTAGLILYPVMKLAAGRWREVRPAAVVLALVCAVYYVRGLVH